MHADDLHPEKFARHFEDLQMVYGPLPERGVLTPPACVEQLGWNAHPFEQPDNLARGSADPGNLAADSKQGQHAIVSLKG